MSAAIIEIEKKFNQFQHNETLPLHLMIDEVAYLYNQLSSLIIDEKYKLQREHLKTQLIEFFYLKISEEKISQKPAKAISWPRKIFKFVSSIFSVFFAGLSAVSVIKSILNLFFNVSNTLALVTGTLIGVLESIALIGIYVLDGKYANASIRKPNHFLLEYEKQLEMIKLAQKGLLSNRVLIKFSGSAYTSSEKLMTTLGNDVKRKKDELSNLCIESFAKTIAKKFFNILGATLCLGSGIISGKSLLICMGGVALVGTPVGWIVAGLMGAFSLATFVYTRKNSVVVLFDKFVQLHKKVKTSQGKFLASNQQFHSQIKEIIIYKNKREAKGKAKNRKKTNAEIKYGSFFKARRHSWPFEAGSLGDSPGVQQRFPGLSPRPPTSIR